MASFKSFGIVHFKEDCNMYLAHHELYKTAAEFLKDAVEKEDCGCKIAKVNSWNKETLLQKLLPFVRGNGHVAHRFDFDYYEENRNYFELVRNPGRGHVRCWMIDMQEVERKLGAKV